MFALFRKILMFFVICSILMFPAPTSVFAQGEVPTDQFTFLQLGRVDTSLRGPYDSRTFTFGLPADWQLNGGGELELIMSVSFNQPVAVNADVPMAVSGGILSVEFNNNVIGVFPLNQIGQVRERITIPVEAMESVRTDGRMSLDLILDSGLSCYLNQQMTVIVHAGSNFTFPHTQVTPDTALNNFPRPLYQASIVQDSVLFVVPDKPSSAELGSALTIAAGLGNLTSSNMLMDLATVSELTAERVSQQDLILVGKAKTMPLLADLTVPANVVSGLFKDSNQDDGVIQMVNSPWNPANVVLLVGGNTDAGVLKAAQAISTGEIRSGTVSNLSVVESVQPVPVNPTLAVYQTLADLGYGNDQLTGIGSNTATYRFNIPPGAAISADSYFELVYSHSALVDYDRSGLVVTLNNRPIGSVRFTDTSAANTENRLRVSIPPSLVLPGSNLLSVTANLYSLDICSDPTLQDLWAMVWPDSFLNLPLGIFPPTAASVMGLDTYPAPFSFDSTLGSSAFVVQKDNPDSWRAALQVAGFLGDRAGVALTTLGAYYADEIPEAEKAKYNLLIVGQPSKLPIIAELNKTLPAPFIDGGDIASQTNLQVTYSVPPSSPVGYLEMVPSPWNPEKVVLTIMGNSSAGIQWAGAALVDPLLRPGLAGNFALIEGTQILTGDTRVLASDPGAIPASATGELGSQTEPIAVRPPTAVRPSWMLPTMIISLVSAVLILVWLAISGRRNRHPKARL